MGNLLNKNRIGSCRKLRDLQSVRGESALRPVRGMSGLRPGRSVSGLRSERIISGLHVAAVLLVFFLLLRPDWLPPVGLLGSAGAGRRPHPRRNGARLPSPPSAPPLARYGAGAVIAFGGLDRRHAAGLFLGCIRREGVGPRHAGIGCRCARRMRRLPAALAAFARRG